VFNISFSKLLDFKIDFRVIVVNNTSIPAYGVLKVNVFEDDSLEALVVVLGT
jgi:hypothetical protein